MALSAHLCRFGTGNKYNVIIAQVYAVKYDSVNCFAVKVINRQPFDLQAFLL